MGKIVAKDEVWQRVHARLLDEVDACHAAMHAKPRKTKVEKQKLQARVDWIYGHITRTGIDQRTRGVFIDVESCVMRIYHGKQAV